MALLSWRSSNKKKNASITEGVGPSFVISLFVLIFLPLSSLNATGDKPLTELPNIVDRAILPQTDHLGQGNVLKYELRSKMISQMRVPRAKRHPPKSGDHEASCVTFEHNDGLADIVDPLKSTCYDWKGNIIPCDFKRQYAELLLDKPIPASRFIDNQDGTVTDNLTKLTWLKNTNCFGMMNWEGANLAVKSLKDGDCGPDPALILSDGSSAGDWRLPTMGELCTLIDFSRRDPALPSGHMFTAVPPGYHWSATTLDYHAGMAWIVYFESGTTCYEAVTNRAGHILPVRKSLD